MMFPLIYLMIHIEFSVSSFDLALNDTSMILSSSLNILMSLEKIYPIKTLLMFDNDIFKRLKRSICAFNSYYLHTILIRTFADKRSFYGVPQ